MMVLIGPTNRATIGIFAIALTITNGATMATGGGGSIDSTIYCDSAPSLPFDPFDTDRAACHYDAIGASRLLALAPMRPRTMRRRPARRMTPWHASVRSHRDRTTLATHKRAA